MERDAKTEELVQELLAISVEDSSEKIEDLLSRATAYQNEHEWNHRLGEAIGFATLVHQSVLAGVRRSENHIRLI